MISSIGSNRLVREWIFYLHLQSIWLERIPCPPSPRSPNRFTFNNRTTIESSILWHADTDEKKKTKIEIHKQHTDKNFVTELMWRKTKCVFQIKVDFNVLYFCRLFHLYYIPVHIRHKILTLSIIRWKVKLIKTICGAIAI